MSRVRQLTGRSAGLGITRQAAPDHAMISFLRPSRRRRFSWPLVMLGAAAVIAAGAALIIR
jgi:hypothetical protein